MVRSVWSCWWRVVRRRDPWIAVVWLLLGGLLLVGLFSLAVVSTTVPHRLASPAYHPGLLVPQRVPGREAWGVIAVLLLALGGLPWGLAGLFGLSGQVVTGRITGRTFWRIGWHHYDRGWALIAAVVLYGGALGLVGMGLRALAPVLTILLIPTVTLSAPLLIRVVGGLFVDGFTWPQSTRRAFIRRGYGTLVRGAIWTALAGAALAAGARAAWQMSGFVGASLVVLIIVFTAVAGPLWLLTLYSVTTPAADDAWIGPHTNHPCLGQERADQVRSWQILH